MKSWITLFFLLVLVSTLGYTQVTNKLDNLQVGTLTTKTLDVTSTTKASKPCPKMSLIERDAIASPLEGQCVYNSTAKTLNLYDGSAWVEVAGTGGEGGIANWEQNKFYDVYDVVIYNLKIYQCQIQHTSTATFDESKFLELANDVSSSTGILSLTNGGTNKELIPSDQGVVFSDADSLEILPKGANRSVLKIGDTGDLTFGDIDFMDLQGQLTDGQIQDPVSLEKGGTNKALTAQDKAIVYSDNDSLELLAPGTEGQVLKMGALAPEWGSAGVSVSNNYATATELSKLTVPNEVLTEQATGEYYLEKNNNNILSNPSFEGSFPGLWSINVSSDQFGSGSIDGGYTLRALPSNQTVEILQDSSLYVDAFADGSVQGMASARIKTSIAGVKLCPRKANVTQTGLCVTHTGSGKWEHLKVPFILGDTSNGLVILTDSAVSGTIYIDDAFVGAVDLSATQSFDTTCDTIACATEFSVYVSNAGSVVSESLDWVTTCTNVSGTVSCTFTSALSSSLTTGMNCVGNRVGSSGGTVTVLGGPSTTTGFSFTSGNTTSNATSYLCQKQGADYTAALQAQKDYQKTKVSSYSSTNADTDWQACTFSTLAWQGLGTVTSVDVKCKRQGSDLLMRGRFTTGTTTSVEARIPLPNWNGQSLGIKNSGVSVLSRVGNGIRDRAIIDSAKEFSLIAGAGFNYLNVSAAEYAIALNPFSAQTGSGVFLSTQLVDFSASIPIEGWENSNIIIGQFNGLEKCESTLDCTDTFSAKVSSTGVVTSENVDFINGNCSKPSSGIANCSFNTGVFTQTPTCVANRVIPGQTTWSSNETMATIGQISQSGVYVLLTSTTQAATEFNIICQKQGADYIGKTAKAVASTMNTRNPGVENSVIYSAQISSTGVINNELGDFIDGNCTNATTSVCTFNTNAFDETPNCNISAYSTINGVNCKFRSNPTSSSLSLDCYNDAGTNTTQSTIKFLTCMGIKK